MQDLYATTVALVSEDGSDPLEVGAARAERWLAQKLGDVVALREPGNGRHAHDGWEVRWAHRHSEDAASAAIDAVLEHPDSRDATQRWRTALVLSRTPDTCRATIRLSRGATTHELRPRRFTARPPRLVSDLIDTPLRGYAGALQVDMSPRRLRADEMRSFVSDVLRLDGRALPVLVCDAGATGALTPEDVSERLIGLAHVVMLHSTDSWEALRHELPQDYLPYGGARLYWPGFGSDGGSLRHPYFTRAQLAQRPLERAVIHWLMSLSVSQVPRDALPDNLRVAERRARVVALPSTDESQLTAVRADLEESLLEELERALTDIDTLRDENRQLINRTAIAEANLRAVNQWQPAAEGRDESEEPAGTPPDVWGSEFLEALKALESPALAFTPRARACSQRNSYRRPTDMYASLVLLEEIARLYHDRKGSLGGDFAKQARLRNGIRISMQDNSYLDRDRRFSFDARELDREPHVKIDDHTAPTEVGRIYFALDTEASRLVVDWFGVKGERPTAGVT